VRKGPPSHASGPRGPSPVRAGASFLVHDLKSLACRLSSLCQNLPLHYEEPLFRQSALDLLNDTVQHLCQLAGDVRNHEDRILVKLRTDLNQIVSDAIADARPDLAARIRTVESYQDLPTIWGDAYLLRRAFACAIENALEAMRGKRGILTVRTYRRSAGPVVEIADTGAGMEARFVRDGLFRPFITTKADGLGLGAYTMRQVAVLHGGRIRIRSAPEAGTRVIFHFPAEGR
jgi:signal transduction histidine kinase